MNCASCHLQMREVVGVVSILMIVASSATSVVTTRTTAATAVEVAIVVARGRGRTIAVVARPAIRPVARARRTADAVVRARGRHTEGRGRVITNCRSVSCVTKPASTAQPVHFRLKC